MEVQIPNWKDQAGQMFTTLDTNKDGVISSEEFNAYFQPKADESDLKEN